MWPGLGGRCGATDRRRHQADAPDPRWSQELSKLKLLLEQQKTAV